MEANGGHENATTLASVRGRVVSFRQMNDLPEVELRKAALVKELEDEIKKTFRSAKGSHHLSLGLMVLALSCTVVSAVGGIFFRVRSDVVGGIAALSPLVAFIAVNLKLEEKCSWHYRRKDALAALRSRLLYQMPINPTVDDIAAVAEARDILTRDLQKEWEKHLSLNWSGILHSRK